MQSIDSFSSKQTQQKIQKNHEVIQIDNCAICGNIHGGSCTTDPVFFCYYPKNPDVRSAPSQVQIVGSWHKWQRRQKMIREIDTKGQVYFQLPLMIPVGKYQYKFIVDGKWTYDQNTSFAPDPYGSFNNIIQIYPKKAFQNCTGKNDIKITSIMSIQGLKIVGSWDNWVSQTPMQKSYNSLKGCEQNVVYLKLLPNTQYQFKFKLGKQFLVDQKYPTVSNGFGSLNNRIITFSQQQKMDTPNVGMSHGTIKHISHKLKQITCKSFVWQKISVQESGNLPYQWLQGHSMCNIGEFVYIFGGKSRSDFSNALTKIPVHNFNNITVQQVLPNPRAFHNMVSYGNKMLIYGGHNNTILQDYYAFNAIEGAWYLAPQISGKRPQKRQKQTCVLYQNLLVFFGGYYCSPDFEYENFFDQLLVLDIQKMHWVEKINVQGAKPKGRYGHTASIYESNMFIFGGSSIQKTDTINLNDLWRINLQSMTGQLNWQQINFKGKIPIARHGHTMNVLSHFLIIFGGVADKNRSLNDVVVYDILQSTWIYPIIDGTVPRPRFNHAATVVQGEYIMVFGGKTKDQRKSQHIYTLKAKGKHSLSQQDEQQKQQI